MSLQTHQLGLPFVVAVLAGLGGQQACAAPGDLDTAFVDPNVNNTVLACAVAPDGRIIIGGNFTQVSGQARSYFARLNANGSLEYYMAPSFNGPIYAMAIHTGGKYLVGGAFTLAYGSTRNFIARLDPSLGNVDSSFVDSQLDGTVRTIAVQPDGKIVVGGDFTYAGGNWHSRIVRLNANGTVDSSFNANAYPGGSPYPNVNSVAINAGGGLIGLGGGFDYIGPVARRHVGEVIASSGALQYQFFEATPTGLDGDLYAVAFTGADLFIAGNFTTVRGFSRSRIARLDSYGFPNYGWDGGATGANGDVRAIAVDSSGRLVMGGSFTTVNGDPRACVSRIEYNGLNDTTFTPASISGGSPASVQAIALQPNGDIIIGGTFTTVGGQTHNRVARLKGN